LYARGRRILRRPPILNVTGPDPYSCGFRESDEKCRGPWPKSQRLPEAGKSAKSAKTGWGLCFGREAGRRSGPWACRGKVKLPGIRSQGEPRCLNRDGSQVAAERLGDWPMEFMVENSSAESGALVGKHGGGERNFGRRLYLLESAERCDSSDCWESEGAEFQWNGQSLAVEEVVNLRSVDGFFLPFFVFFAR